MSNQEQSKENKQMTLSEKLIEVFLWIIALVVTLIIICTVMAWIAGIALFIMRNF